MFNKYSSRILNDNVIRHYSSPNLTIATDGKDIKLSVESLLASAKKDNWKPSNKTWYQRNYERNNDYEIYLEDFQYLIDWDTYTFKPLISPYSPNLVKRMLGEVGNIDIISYGQSSYGYDARLHEEVYVFTNTNGGEVDPKNFDKDLLVKPKVWDSDNGRYVVIPPNGFLLGRTMEYFHVPRNVNVTCLGKSTMARASIVVNVTPLEAEWHGTVTLELSNTSNLPVRIYLEEGICQFIFMESEAPCEISYADRKGKYIGQQDVTLSKV